MKIKDGKTLTRIAPGSCHLATKMNLKYKYFHFNAYICNLMINHILIAMKRIILLAFLYAMCSISYAQGIFSDEVTSNGVRLIIGDPVHISDITDDVELLVSLCYSANEGITTYGIAVTPAYKSEFSVKKGMRLLLKDKDNNVVELHAMADAYSLINAVDAFHSVYYLNAFYEVSEETLNRLCGGIIKMRLENSCGAFDKEWKVDKMGEVLKKELAEIKHKVNIEKDFYSDF